MFCGFCEYGFKRRKSFWGQIFIFLYKVLFHLVTAETCLLYDINYVPPPPMYISYILDTLCAGGRERWWMEEINVLRGVGCSLFQESVLPQRQYNTGTWRHLQGDSQYYNRQHDDLQSGAKDLGRHAAKEEFFQE